MEIDATMSDTVSLFSALMGQSTYTNIQIKKSYAKTSTQSEQLWCSSLKGLCHQFRIK
jgi:hypothetical protein